MPANKNKNKPNKNKPNKDKGKPQKLTKQQFSALIHGSAYPQLKASLNKKQWARLKKEAKRRGTTVEGMASGLPPALRPQTPGGLAKQAKSTVNKAYAGAFADLTNQEGRVNDIDAKRARDNRSYTTWLDEQHQRLATEGRAADAALLSHQDKMQQDVDAVHLASQAEARSRAANATGNVSDPSKSFALDLSPERIKGNESVANARAQTQAQIGSNQKSSNYVAGANALFMGAQEAKRQSDTYSALKKIGEDRQELRLDRAGDLGKELSRLLDREITKAQGNREFAAAAQKLGLDAQEFKFERQKFAKEFGLKKDQFAWQMSQDEIDNRLETIDRKLAQQGLNDDRRHDLASERIQLISALKNPGKKPKGKDLTGWRQYRGLIGKAKAFGAKKGNEKKIAQLLAMESGNYDPLLIQAAVQVAVSGKAKSSVAAQIKKLYRFNIPQKTIGPHDIGATPSPLGPK